MPVSISPKLKSVCAASELASRSVAVGSGRARLGAVEGPVYLSCYFVRSPLFSCRKVILGGGAGNALWKQEAQVIHVLRNAGRRGGADGGRGSAPSVFKGTL